MLGLFKIGGLDFLSSTVADVKHFNTLLSLQNAIDHSIDMRLVAIKQVPEAIPFRRLRAPVRPFSQALDGPFEISVPFQGHFRKLRVD